MCVTVSLSLKMGEEGGDEGGVKVEWWWSEGGVVVVGPPTSSTEIQRRWEGLTPGVAALLSWTHLVLRAVLNLYPVGRQSDSQ